MPAIARHSKDILRFGENTRPDERREGLGRHQLDATTETGFEKLGQGEKALERLAAGRERDKEVKHRCRDVPRFEAPTQTTPAAPRRAHEPPPRSPPGAALQPRAIMTPSPVGCKRMPAYRACPPATWMTCPVIQRVLSEDRRTTTSAMSSGVPRRRSGMVGSSCRSISVVMYPV